MSRELCARIRAKHKRLGDAVMTKLNLGSLGDRTVHMPWGEILVELHRRHKSMARELLNAIPKLAARYDPVGYEYYELDDGSYLYVTSAKMNWASGFGRAETWRRFPF